MNFTLQDSNVSINKVGEITKENGIQKVPVDFTIGSENVTLDILVKNEDYINQNDFENFYIKNKEVIEKSLTDYFTENQTYKETIISF